KWNAQGTIAAASDGSRAYVVHGWSRKYHILPDGDLSHHVIYDRAQHSMYFVNDKTKELSVAKCPCFWSWNRASGADPDCSETASMLDVHHRVGYGSIAGVPTIRYRDDDSAEARELSFAPLYGCELMEEFREN